MSVAGPKAPSLLPTCDAENNFCPNPPSRGTKTTRREESEKMSSIAIARQHRARSLRKLADCGRVRTA